MISVSGESSAVELHVKKISGQAFLHVSKESSSIMLDSHLI